MCREQGIRKEYEELDTVWFMTGSLFHNYPFQVPSEAFSYELFLQVASSADLLIYVWLALFSSVAWRW